MVVNDGLKLRIIYQDIEVLLERKRSRKTG